MYPYFFNKKLSNISAWLAMLCIVLILILPSSTLKLIFLGLTIGFMVLFAVFISKTFEQNEEEEKQAKKILDEKINSMKILLIVFAVIFVLVILFAVLKYLVNLF